MFFLFLLVVFVPGMISLPAGHDTERMWYTYSFWMGITSSGGKHLLPFPIGGGSSLHPDRDKRVF